MNANTWTMHSYMFMETFKLSDTLLKDSLSTAEDIQNKHGIISLHALQDV